jgi:hypothetical protein
MYLENKVIQLEKDLAYKQRQIDQFLDIISNLSESIIESNSKFDDERSYDKAEIVKLNQVNQDLFNQVLTLQALITKTYLVEQNPEPALMLEDIRNENEQYIYDLAILLSKSKVM